MIHMASRYPTKLEVNSDPSCYAEVLSQRFFGINSLDDHGGFNQAKHLGTSRR